MSQFADRVRTFNRSHGIEKKEHIGSRRLFATLMFTDIEDWTGLSVELGLEQSAQYLIEHFAVAKNIVRYHGGDILDFTGDGVLAIWPCETLTHAETARHALDAATDIAKKQEALCLQRQDLGIPYGRTRIGLHFGEVMLGELDDGRSLFAAGATNYARRVEQAGKSVANVDDDVVIMASTSVLRLVGFGPSPMVGTDIQRVVLKRGEDSAFEGPFSKAAHSWRSEECVA